MPSKNTSGLKIKRRAHVCVCRGRQNLDRCLVSKQAGGQRGSTASKETMADRMTVSYQVLYVHTVCSLRWAGSRAEGQGKAIPCFTLEAQ